MRISPFFEANTEAMAAMTSAAADSINIRLLGLGPKGSKQVGGGEAPEVPKC